MAIQTEEKANIDRNEIFWSANMSGGGCIVIYLDLKIYRYIERDILTDIDIYRRLVLVKPLNKEEANLLNRSEKWNIGREIHFILQHTHTYILCS